MLGKLRPYYKTIAAALGATAIALQSAYTDGEITSAEWVAIGIAALTALGVFGVENKPATSP